MDNMSSRFAELDRRRARELVASIRQRARPVDIVATVGIVFFLLILTGFAMLSFNDTAPSMLRSWPQLALAGGAALVAIVLLVAQRYLVKAAVANSAASILSQPEALAAVLGAVDSSAQAWARTEREQGLGSQQEEQLMRRYREVAAREGYRPFSTGVDATEKSLYIAAALGLVAWLVWLFYSGRLLALLRGGEQDGSIVLVMTIVFFIGVFCIFGFNFRRAQYNGLLDGVEQACDNLPDLEREREASRSSYDSRIGI